MGEGRIEMEILSGKKDMDPLGHGALFRVW